MSESRPRSDLQDVDRSHFVELVCPTCHVVSGKILEHDLIAQRTFDDVHRRCYVNVVPDRRPGD